MYEQIFHFDSRPFTATPYVKHYFAGDAIHQSLAQARVCVDRGTGPVIVIGATGTGKSLLLAMLEEQYQSQFNVVNLGCARLDERRELLQSVLYELQLPFKDLPETELRFSLIDYLKPSEKCPNGILLLVDEAHALSTEMLDEIRLITNFVREGQPRVRLVMAGTQNLEENLNDSKLESFNQRIAARCYLGNMSRDETARYVTEHIDRAGGDGAQLFRDDSLRAIHDVTDGCPRLINQVCDHALILAATRAENEITDDCIREAWADVQSIPGSFKPSGSTSAMGPDLKKGENWTVIEFGQLDENSSESEQDTVSEFENATPEQKNAPVDNMSETLEPDENQKPGIENHDGGQEIEFPQPIEDSKGSEDQREEAQMHETASATSDEEAGLIEDDDSSDEHGEFGDVQLGSEEQGGANSELDSESVTDTVDSAASPEMEAQLAAVFGSSSDNEPELISGNADISDLELEQSQILDQVESDQSRIFGIDEDSEFIALGDGQASENEEEPVDSQADGDFDNDLIDDQEHVDTQSVSHPTMDSLVPEHEASLADADSDSFPSDSQEADWVHAEQVESEEVAAIQPQLRQPVETVDPFDEPFAEEENLIDRYAPFVAHQNQSSLTVTSEDLAMLTPDDEREQTELRSPAIFDVDQSSTGPTDDHEEPLFAADDQPFDLEEESRQHESDEPVSAGDAAADQDDPMDRSEANHSVLESVIEQEMALVSDSESDTISETHSEEFLEESEDSSDPACDATAQDVQNEAEEILKRLNKSRRVSCETSPGEITNEESASIESISENDEQSGEEHVATNSSSSSPQVELVESEYTQQSAALDESQQILNEILEQRHALAKQREKLPADDSDALADPDTKTENRVSDDPEMIIVSPMELPSDSPASEVEHGVPFPSTPVSTGRAERMDYQKLFDQLRDISTSKE